MAYENQDVFALLPEALLITILSLLPLKDAVRTSVLAKYWRNLWCCRPNVEINEHLFPLPVLDAIHQNDEFIMVNNKIRRQNDVLNFGFWWLEKTTLPPTISSFTLAFSDPQHCLVNIDNLIRRALDRNTKSLELDFSSLEWEDQLPQNHLTTPTEMYDLPHSVYYYESLESLKLVSCRFMEDIFMILGRTLRSIYLGWIELTHVSKLRILVTSCPLLESLTLFKCFYSTDYVIESQSLTTLVVDKCADVLHITIIAPNLRCFKYCGEFVEFGMSNFPRLETADIHFDVDRMVDEEDGNKIAQLLYNLFFARSLKVCGFVTQVLPVATLDIKRLPGQLCARNLTIKTAFHESEFEGILKLLDSYPFVEKLRFEFGQQTILQREMVFFGYDGASEYFWAEATPSQTGCVRRSLRVVEFTGFRGVFYEINLLTFLLSHGHASLHTLILRVAANDQRANHIALCLRMTIQVHRAGLNVEVIS